MAWLWRVSRGSYFYLFQAVPIVPSSGKRYRLLYRMWYTTLWQIPPSLPDPSKALTPPSRENAFRPSFIGLRLAGNRFGNGSRVCGGVTAADRRGHQDRRLGWPVGMPVCRPVGSGVYEVRSDLGRNRIARVLFYFDRLGQMVLLHGFIKKTQKTPDDDLELAQRNKKKHERSQ